MNLWNRLCEKYNYETGLIEYLSATYQSTLDTIVQSGKLNEKTESELKKALESFTKIFIK